MGILIKMSCAILLLSMIGFCETRRPVPETPATTLPRAPPLQLPTFQKPDVQSVLNNIPPNASREEMDRGVESLLSLFSSARVADAPDFAAAFITLREQPHIVASFVGYYERLPKANHDQRMTTLSFLGELQRPDAMPFLNKTIWTTLPKRQRSKEGLSLRDLEEMVLVKAVHGVGYLRTPDADKALIEVMRRHESRAVKIGAIDTYMWNHGDTSNAAQELFGILDRELHKFVERPRFYRGMDRQRFNEQLKAWRSKWGSS
jgi:hypothetical protein